MITGLIRSLRLKHWIKNAFIFLPLVFGKKILSYPENWRALEAFFAFSLASSAVYLINDVIDRVPDSAHPDKMNRPVASGTVPVPVALSAAALLGLAALFGSFMITPPLGATIVAYLALNVLYSLFLKRAVIIDVFCIAFFFLLRILAGSVVSGVVLSHWILFLTALLALFLGFNKRRQELGVDQDGRSRRKVLDKYEPYFIDQMISLITSSIVVVYMLYTVDAATVAHFQTQHLMFTIPFVYYGIFRYLYLIHRLQWDGDPTTMLFRDTRMQLNLALWLAVCMGVIYFGL